MYWITVLSALDNLTLGLMIVCGILFIGFTIAALVNHFDNEPDIEHTCKVWSIITGFLFFINAMATVFLPNKTELYAIYGIGGTIDYLKDNPDAKALPDKTIKMLNLMADEFIDKHKKSSDDDKDDDKGDNTDETKE